MPRNAELRVQVLDKDDGASDDYIGKFTTDVHPGAKEEEIEGPVFKRNKGTFWLKVGCHSTLITSLLNSVVIRSPDRKHALDRPLSRAAPVRVRWAHSILPPFLPHRWPPDEHQRRPVILNVEDVHQGRQTLLWRRIPTVEPQIQGRANYF